MCSALRRSSFLEYLDLVVKVFITAVRLLADYSNSKFDRKDLQVAVAMQTIVVFEFFSAHMHEF